MMLSGARVATSAKDSCHVDLLIRYGRILIPDVRGYRGRNLDLSGFMILPGLINSHDHLELNLFPRLGRGLYKNATAWAEDIYHPDESPVKQQLGVPKAIRLVWGGIKNLLSGVTSVAHHNPYEPEVFNHDFPVRVVKHYGWAHSVHFSPDWLARFRRTSRRLPFIIHAAEGVDEESRCELHQLEKASALGPSTVLVHGVALKPADLEILRRRKVSLIWCPSSNCFMLGRTICAAILCSELPIALGTDSALTADGDLIDELRKASEIVDPVRLYRMVTADAARILRLESAVGCIKSGRFADLLVVQDRGQTPAEALIDLQPELVFVGGRINLVSEKAAGRLRRSEFADYQKIETAGRGSCWVPFKITNLISQTKQALGGTLHLAGKAVIS